MKNYFLIATLLVVTSVLAQNNTSITLEKQKLKQALLYNDQQVAASAMYNIIALEGEKSTYKDSLAYLYFNAGKHVSSFLVSNDVLKNNPNNTEILEINAISLETMGAFDKALESFKKLNTKEPSAYLTYKIASLQLTIKKFDEALVSIKKAAQYKDDTAIKIGFKINDNYNQQVPLKPA
ncbi:MAG TPA: hypothetical protein VJ970_01745, partial [Flavobacteriaceae bacterium]|nr:hypothetical protein [Flavobacteriaceae bacterium]